MAVITFNGQIGSGGRDLGELVAQRMGVHYVDQQILVEAAKRIGAPVEALAQRDEKVSSLRERIGRFLQNFLEKSAAAGATGDPFLGPSGMEVLLSRSYSDVSQMPTTRAQELSDLQFMQVTSGVIMDLAQMGNVVIIGRGSNIILKDFPGALHLNTIASLSTRYSVMARREHLDMVTAERLTKEREIDRLAFFRKFFKVDATDPSLYHLVLNLDKLSLEMASDTVCSLAERLEQAAKR